MRNTSEEFLERKASEGHQKANIGKYESRKYAEEGNF